MSNNVLTAALTSPSQVTYTRYAWQYDYGQILKFTGVDLPEAYEVHFSYAGTGGVTITQIGNADGVAIPDQFFMADKNINVYLFLHSGEDDGETVYNVIIPVKGRPAPSDMRPSTVEQSEITQAIAALNHAVEETSGYAGAAKESSLASEGYAKGSQNGTDVESGSPYYQANAKYYKEQAASSATSAETSASGASASALKAEGFAVGEQNGAGVGSDSPYYHNNAEYFKEKAADSATAAGNSASGSADSALVSEGYAKGSQNGAAVASGSPYYHANAEYYKEQAASSATSAGTSASGASASALKAEGFAVGEQNGAGVGSDSPYYHNNAEYYAGQAAASAQSIAQSAQQISTNTNDIANLKSDVDDLEEAIDALEAAKKFGVSGIGQSASQLTRIWDAVGMVAQVGTDGDNSAVINNFDNVAPFNRRKCVGHWELDNGKPSFVVQAYFGDADYTEDGTMGDYVAVECPLAYYYMVGDVLGVSAYPWPGWRPFDIFCQGHDPAHTIPYAYLPAYALALKDGKAVSLPGLDNYQGDYKGVIDACRTYAGDVGAKAISQPMAVNFYEWALFTVEFAQQDSQKAMRGCADLRHNNDDRATLRSDGKWLLNNYFASRVAGEYISLQPTNIDINAVSWYASHKIVSIIRCDASGNESSSGTYQLMEVQDLGTGREYEIGSDYRIGARPYRTGECNGVSTPSGSPVSNSNGYYPMKYRWRENVFANQFKTICDLFNKRVGTGDDDYKLEWYFLPVPEDYTPSTSSKPDATDLASDAFVKLDVETAHENYLSGYIKSRKYSQVYPDIWIPFETTGGSGTTYYADYASLVNSHVVRAVRLGGYWNYGATDGFSYVNGAYAPSYGNATYGGDLFFPQ